MPKIKNEIWEGIGGLVFVINLQYLSEKTDQAKEYLSNYTLKGMKKIIYT